MGAVCLVDDQSNFNFESLQRKYYRTMLIYGSIVFSLKGRIVKIRSSY